MTVGFVMLAHEALNRAAQTVRVIAKQGCPVFVHIDARVNAQNVAAFGQAVSDLDNVRLVTRRRCEWGTWSLVAASRATALELLESYPELTHVGLISGACLPIKPMEDLRQLLSQHRGTDFIESVTIDEVSWTKGGLSQERFDFTFPFPWKRSRRLFDVWVECQRRIKRRRRKPDGLAPHMGSQWWCLTRETLETIANDPNRRKLDRYFKRVWIPDESYFQTLVRLYDRQVESRSLTLSKFDFKGKPHVFYDDHLILLRQSSEFFARKIWPGANRLYRAFLAVEPVGVPTRPASAAHIDRTFAEAVHRRTKGRPGLVMASRYPSKGFENQLTAQQYSVFHGFGDVFQNFTGWVGTETGSRAHGHLFGPDRAQFAGDQSGYAGALSDHPVLRDYDPEAFLRNLVWNTRGEHQSFLFSPRDAQQVTDFMLRDSNATIFAATGAWAIPLLHSGRAIADVRKEAALLQSIEADFLKRLTERHVLARVKVWTLGEILEHPTQPLQAILESLSTAERPHLNATPPLAPLDGLANFLQRLRNAGMNPHVAGQVNEAMEGAFQGDTTLQVAARLQ